MYELSTAKPHEYRDRGYSMAEWPIYCEGYYHALAMALKVMQIAAERFAARTRERRLANKAARSKIGAA